MKRKIFSLIASICLISTAVAVPTANAIIPATAFNIGSYAYESQAASINITSKSDDTLTSSDFSIAGTVNKSGTISLDINGASASTQSIAYANGSFSFSGKLNAGRNDVNLYFSDNSGNITRKSFNFVYLQKTDVIVDRGYSGTDGSSSNGIKTYKSVQAAVNSLKSASTKRTVFVKNGNYNERVTVSASNISIIGQDSKKTRIYYSIASKDASGMTERNCMKIDKNAQNFTLENITVENSYPYTNGSNEQADAICILADGVICTNVRFVGYQDTLLTDSSSSSVITRQYFYKCYITGNVDFIYGRARSFFEDCDIVGRYTSYKSDGCFMAPRTESSNAYGYVFNNCRFTAENGIGNGKYRLARPWGANASATFLNCYMSPCVLSTAYGDMSGNSYKNARFAEYSSYGSGASINSERPQLSASQAAGYTASKVFSAGMNSSFDYSSIMNSMYNASGSSIITTQPTSVTSVTSNNIPIGKSYTHNFTTDASNSEYFTFTGAISYDKGTVTYNSLNLNDCLKLDSKGSLTFTLSTPSSLTLVVKSKIDNGAVYLNGSAIPALSDISTSGNVRTFTLDAGTYTLSKGVGETYIYYADIKAADITTAETTTVTTAPTTPETTVTTAMQTLYGDLNLDGSVTGTDVIRFTQHFLGINVLNGQAQLNADVLLDGNIALTDLAKLKQYCTGDKITLGI